MIGRLAAGALAGTVSGFAIAIGSARGDWVAAPFRAAKNGGHGPLATDRDLTNISLEAKCPGFIRPFAVERLRRRRVVSHA